MKLNGTLWGAIALTCTFGAGVAAAARMNACADLNNNGVCDAGDVSIDKQLANDGYFSTDRAEGDYTPPPSGKVGIVMQGRVSGRRGVVYVVASGDVTIGATGAGGGGDDDATVVVSKGSVHVKDGARVRGGLFLKLQAAGDIDVGRSVQFSARNNDFGGQLYLVSDGGKVTLGERSSVVAGGYLSIQTNADNGGDIKVGKNSKLVSNKGTVSVTAGKELDVQDTTISGRAAILGSHASGTGRTAAGPGHATVRDSSISVDDGVRLYADGAESMLDITGTTIAADPGNVTLDADVVVK